MKELWMNLTYLFKKIFRQKVNKRRITRAWIEDLNSRCHRMRSILMLKTKRSKGFRKKTRFLLLVSQARLNQVT